LTKLKLGITSNTGELEWRVRVMSDGSDESCFKKLSLKRKRHRDLNLDHSVFFTDSFILFLYFFIL